MDKPNATLRGLRQHVFREPTEIIADRIHRVDHYSLRGAGMRALPLERYRSGACAPRLITNLTELFSVNRVSDFCAEAFHVKLLNAGTDLFIRRESNRKRAVFDLRILTQCVDHRHDLSDARLIV